MINNVLVIGGGASGMVAAISAARNGANVSIIEQQNELGKKILATGNGRCNYSNVEMKSSCYYCEDTSFIDNILERYSTRTIIDFFESIGISPKDKNGYLYPFSEQASCVRDALVYEINQLNIKVYLETAVTSIMEVAHTDAIGDTSNGYVITAERIDDKSKSCHSLEMRCNSVILATGGKSGLTKQNKYDGYFLIKQLNHHLTTLSPGLVPLKGQGNFFKKIAGIRTDASVTAFIDSHPIRTEIGELQLTDYGVSGIPIFQISRILTQYMTCDTPFSPNPKVVIDFLPSYSYEEFLTKLSERRALLKNRTMKQFLNGILKEKLASFLLDMSRINEATLVENISNSDFDKLVRICKSFSITVTGSKDFKQSQVTAGGIRIDEINNNLQSIYHKNLYFTGEILDVDGICGGYNLHFAWATGLSAGHTASSI